MSAPGAARRALLPLASLVLLWAASGCDSTALALEDPNAINVSFDPEFVEPDATEVSVEVRFVDVEDPDEGGPGSRAVGDWDFGEGLFLVSWEFHSDFHLTIVLQRFADAPKGRRSLSLEVHNPHGTFLARGEFTVL